MMKIKADFAARRTGMVDPVASRSQVIFFRQTSLDFLLESRACVLIVWKLR
jgi:hypothetical protein